MLGPSEQSVVCMEVMESPFAFSAADSVLLKDSIGLEGKVRFW